MSTKKGNKKVITTKKKTISPTISKRSKVKVGTVAPRREAKELIFGKQNYILMFAGIVLIIIGMLLMTGGHMPSRDVWDDNLIYSFRRVTLAPIVILAGLGLEVYAIFK